MEQGAAQTQLSASSAQPAHGQYHTQSQAWAQSFQMLQRGQSVPPGAHPSSLGRQDSGHKPAMSLLPPQGKQKSSSGGGDEAVSTPCCLTERPLDTDLQEGWCQQEGSQGWAQSEWRSQAGP